MAQAEKLIYDGDPGHDDAMAIILAAGNPKLDLLGVTTVGGNTSLANVTKNTLMLMDLMNKDIPVIAGCAAPLVRELKTAPMVHGESGLEGAKLFEPKRKALDMHAVDWLIDTLMASDGDINVVTGGPMTNLAIAVTREPRIIPKIKSHLMMAGGRYGNMTGTAEFNVWADAEAAKIMFKADIKKRVMCGLNLTYQARATKEVFDKLSEIKTPLGDFVNDFMRFYAKSPSARKENGPAVNDACPVAYLIDPEVFTTEFLHVDIETGGEFTYGTTVVDFYRMNPWKDAGEPNTLVGMDINLELFWRLLLDAISSFK